jgi:hypothetical protein
MWPAYAEAIERHLGSHLDRARRRRLAAILSRLLDPASLTGPMCGSVGSGGWRGFRKQ